MMPDPVLLNVVRENRQIEQSLDKVAPPLPNGGGGGTSDGMDTPALSERVSKVESALEGLRHGQNMLLGAVGIGFGLVIAIMIYMLTRIDSIPSEFKDTTQAISTAITAASAKPQQVLIVPAPPAAKP